MHPGPHGIQLFPALTYRDAELAELLKRVRTGLTAYARTATAGAAGVAG
ncbi:hypothetical protein [Streptomyces sp. NPDC096193]